MRAQKRGWALGRQWPASGVIETDNVIITLACFIDILDKNVQRLSRRSRPCKSYDGRTHGRFHLSPPQEYVFELEYAWPGAGARLVAGRGHVGPGGRRL